MSVIGANSTLGRYRLVAGIGEGGMGEVWKAHDDKLDRGYLPLVKKVGLADAHFTNQ